MDHLSIEVLTLIFVHLHREQKLQCRLVCRKWNHLIRSGLDLETVAISSSPSSTLFDMRYRLLLKKVLDDSSTGKKCKRLVLDHHSRVGFNKVTLAELFPNLTFLALLLIETKSSNTTPVFTKEQSRKLETWRNTLETLIERSYTKRLFDFLDTGVFRRLTTLVVTPDTKVLYSHFSALSKVLKNTPALQKLHLNYHHVDLVDLDELHRNVPALISLIMNTCRLSSSKEIPLNRQPSTLIRTLKLSTLSSTLSSTSEIVQFFASAYTHLQSLSLIIGEYDSPHYRNTDVPLESFFTEFVTKIGHNLTELEFRIPMKTPQVYSFLEKRATRLKRLDINVLLSKRVLYNMVSLASIHHLETLSLVQVPPLYFGIFKKLGGLKVLHLAFKQRMINWFPVYLGEMLTLLPETLERLELSYVKIVANLTTVSSNIRRLKLTYTEITENVSRILPTCFDKLNSLVLCHCQMGDNLDFSNHRLSYVHIIYYERHYCAGHLEAEELDSNKRISTHLKLTTRDTSNCYMYRKPLYNGINPRFNTEYCDVHDHALQNLGRPAPFDETLKYLHFKCNSVHSFYYNGYLLL